MFKSNTVYPTDGTCLERELRGQCSLERRCCGNYQRMHQFEISARHAGNSSGRRLFEAKIKHVNIPAVDTDMCQEVNQITVVEVCKPRQPARKALIRDRDHNFWQRPWRQTLACSSRRCTGA